MAHEPQADSGLELTRLAGGRDGLFTDPVYHRRGLPGAVPDVWVREEVAERLAAAVRALDEEGLGLLVLDGWRPRSVQAALWERYRNELHAASSLEGAALESRLREFVSPPGASGSPPAHSTGGAVDVTLCTPDGAPLDMGGDFDELTDRSHPDFYERPGLAGADLVYRDRRRLLLRAMGSAGFWRLPTEWWHFEYGTSGWASQAGAAPRFGEAEAPLRPA
jgi:zinc D-Ala-D-Ala dipeptidase